MKLIVVVLIGVKDFDYVDEEIIEVVRDWRKMVIVEKIFVSVQTLILVDELKLEHKKKVLLDLDSFVTAEIKIIGEIN